MSYKYINLMLRSFHFVMFSERCIKQLKLTKPSFNSLLHLKRNSLFIELQMCSFLLFNELILDFVDRTG